MNINVVTDKYTDMNPPDKMSTTTDLSSLVEIPKEGTPIFLQTRAAQCIAGVFVWIALFLTCQQVSIANNICEATPLTLLLNDNSKAISFFSFVL